MGYDRKYGKVTTEHGDIPDDEPVIVFRARDAMLCSVINFYAEACKVHGSPQRHLALIRGAVTRIARWQAEHPDQVHQPDSERSRAWMGDEVT